jgi:hypothetical protein
MTRSYYVRDEEAPSIWIRRIIIPVMVVVLAAAAAAGIFIESGNRQPRRLLDRFEQAMQSSDYSTAIVLYRDAQEKAMASGFLNQNQDLYKDVLSNMEDAADQKLDLVESALLRQEQLDGPALSFVEGMAELSAARLSSFLRKLCEDFLTGEIGRPVLESAFAQLAPLDNLKDAVGSLPDEIDRMAKAQQPMIAALASLDKEDYWAAYDGLLALRSDDALMGFVREKADIYLEACKTAMHDPLLSDARALMEGGRYLSAKTALEKMMAVFPDDPAIQAEIETCRAYVPDKLVNYLGSIEFIVIKPLIINPARAFDNDAYAAAADESMITAGEFQNMLEQLYANHYILIDSTRFYDDSRHVVTLKLPEGKKPLVLVIEGLNYYATRRETGNCWDLTIDEGGEVSAVYPDDSGNMKIDRRGEAIGILDEFVALHPDFSLDGAKGTISMTGYECVFGKITDADQLDDRNLALQNCGMQTIELTDTEIEANREEARAIVNRLKMTGWLFASSTYGFIDARSQTMERIMTDTHKWLEQVGSLTGPVSMLNYPNGSFITGSDERAEWLKEQGFILFAGLAGMGQSAYLFTGADYIYVDKTPISGATLRHSADYKLERFFDAAKVYDRSLP